MSFCAATPPVAHAVRQLTVRSVGTGMVVGGLLSLCNVYSEVEFPDGALAAIAIGAGAGVVLALLEQGLPARYARFVPSAPSMGLAFVLPAYYAFSVFLGAMLALGLARRRPRTAERFTTVAAAGIVAGESLVGVGAAVVRLAAGRLFSLQLFAANASS